MSRWHRFFNRLHAGVRVWRFTVWTGVRSGRWFEFDDYRTHGGDSVLFSAGVPQRHRSVVVMLRLGRRS